MIMKINFEGVSIWCEAHGFPWTIRNNSIYWQTNYQTGQITKNGETFWHKHNYFDEIVNRKEYDYD